MAISATTLTFCRLSPTEIAERKKKGLCFNYDDQFVPSHRCACLFILEVNDSLNYEEPDDTTHLLTDFSNEESYVPLQAMTGLWRISAYDTMQLDVCTGTASSIVILDTGSTHNFIHNNALALA
jgi:hypothetical protein